MQRGWRYAAKRLIDLTVATTALILLSPLLGLIALAVALRLGRPIFFKQERLGRSRRPFFIVKFRTMLDARDDVGRPLPDAERLTSFGRFLRQTSLDELPELWNVLTGDMSLVGPRPYMAQYGPYYSPEQNRRHDVMPGITGWAQVNGRNALTWDERFALDRWYVDNWSLTLDLRILGRTFAGVVRREGIAFEDHATSPLLFEPPPDTGT